MRCQMMLVWSNGALNCRERVSDWNEMLLAVPAGIERMTLIGARREGQVGRQGFLTNAMMIGI